MVPKLEINEKIGFLKKYSQEMPNFHLCSTYLQVDKKKGYVLNVFKISEHELRWQLKPWGCYLKCKNSPHQLSTNMSWHKGSESKNLILSNYDSDTTVTEILKHESKIILSHYLCLSFFNIFIIAALLGLWRFNKLLK